MLRKGAGIPCGRGRISGCSSTASDVNNPLTRNLLSRNPQRSRRGKVPARIMRERKISGSATPPSAGGVDSATGRAGLSINLNDFCSVCLRSRLGCGNMLKDRSQPGRDRSPSPLATAGLANKGAAMRRVGGKATAAKKKRRLGRTTGPPARRVPGHPELAIGENVLLLSS